MSLQVWLPLNGSIVNQGLNNGTITWPTAATYTENGKIGKALATGAATMSAEMTSQILNNKAISIALWLYVNADADDSTNRAMIFGNDSMSALGGRQFSIFRYPYSDDIHLSWQNCINGTYTSILTGVWSGILTPRAWNHICVTYDNPTAKIYVNGIQVGTANGVMNTDSFYFDTKLIYNSTSHYINDFRIYDHCLSQKEIKELSKGLVLHYKLDKINGGNPNIIPNTSVEERQYTYPTSGFQDKFAVTTTVIPTATQYTLSFYAKSTVAGDKIRAHYYSPNTTTTCVSSQGITKTASDGNMDFTLSTSWEQYWVTYTQTETTVVKHVILPRMGAQNNNNGVISGTGTVSIKCVKLEAGDKPTLWLPNSIDSTYTSLGLDQNLEFDCSGYNNNGTIIGTLTNSTDTPKYKVSTLFNGSADIRTSNGSFSWWDFKEGTVCAWMKPTATNSSWFGSIGIQADDGAGYRSFNIGDYANKASWIIGYDTSWGQVQSSVTMEVDTWYHLALTITNGTNVILYVNGESVKTGTITNSSGTINANTKFAVGIDLPGGDERFTGQISDVRFYSTALSAEDIKELYETPASIDNKGNMYAYEFEEV